jgi:hypothetical protein
MGRFDRREGISSPPANRLHAVQGKRHIGSEFGREFCELRVIQPTVPGRVYGKKGSRRIRRTPCHSAGDGDVL